MSRQVAILGGGDWYDASVDHLTVPDDMDLDAQKKLHDEWYENEYRPALQAHRDAPPGNKPKFPKYITLVDWLRQHGATDSTVEIFDDCP